MSRAAIQGSAPEHAGYRRVSAVVPETQVRVTVVLRPRDSSAANALLSGKYEPSMKSSLGADESAKTAVEQYLRANGLTIAESDAAARTIVVTGPASAIDHAFGVQLGEFAAADGKQYMSYEGALTMPQEIAGSVLAVLGLDDRPVARPH